MTPRIAVSEPAQIQFPLRTPRLAHNNRARPCLDVQRTLDIRLYSRIYLYALRHDELSFRYDLYTTCLMIIDVFTP